MRRLVTVTVAAMLDLVRSKWNRTALLFVATLTVHVNYGPGRVSERVEERDRINQHTCCKKI